ncbi:MAG: hypothetical protein ACTSR2_12665 [Candidatus Hodarchaeales archaeon]
MLKNIELYQLSDETTGDLEPYTDPSHKLKKDSVYVLLDDTLKKIFLWIGQSSGVRSRFIATTAAQQLQRLKGLTHRVITVDEGNEPEEFKHAFSAFLNE